MKNLFVLCDDKHKFIYEINKEVFGNIFTLEEEEYWAAFSLMKSAESYGISIKNLTYDETIAAIKKKEKETRSK